MGRALTTAGPPRLRRLAPSPWRSHGATFHGQAGLAPLLHPATQDRDLRKAGGVQGSRRRCRALVGPADQDERSPFEPGKLGQSAGELANGNIARGRDVAEGARELVEAAHVDDGHCFAAVEPAPELLRLDPLEWFAYGSDKRRARGDRRELRTRQERADAHRSRARRPSGYRPASPRKGWSSIRSSRSSCGSR